MNDFMYRGQRVHVLDLSVERGYSKRTVKHYKSFVERAEEEANALTENKRKFVTIYSSYCIEQYAKTPEWTLCLSLTGASYVYPQSQKKMTATSTLAVFYNQDGKFLPLWEVRHFESNKQCIFMDRPVMEQKLRNIFKSLEITLGSLSFKGVSCIAWRLETDEGIFYIPWHNGAIIESIDGFSFEEKPLEKMKNTYSVLLFAPSYPRGLYQILRC